MNREEYMKLLQHRLRRLPKEDYNRAIAYFIEYFEEAGPEREAQAIEDLGSPELAADQIIRDFAVENADGPAKNVKKRILCPVDRHSGGFCRTGGSAAGTGVRRGDPCHDTGGGRPDLLCIPDRRFPGPVRAPLHSGQSLACFHFFCRRTGHAGIRAPHSGCGNPYDHAQHLNYQMVPARHDPSVWTDRERW